MSLPAGKVPSSRPSLQGSLPVPPAKVIPQTVRVLVSTAISYGVTALLSHVFTITVPGAQIVIQGTIAGVLHGWGEALHAMGLTWWPT